VVFGHFFNSDFLNFNESMGIVKISSLKKSQRSRKVLPVYIKTAQNMSLRKAPNCEPDLLESKNFVPNLLDNGKRLKSAASS
jgi:hypothetical protein